MMKKSLIVFLAFAVLLCTLLPGCGGKEAAQPGGASQASAEQGEPAKPAEPEKAPMKVALVTPQAKGDSGPVDDMIKGLERARDEFGVEINMVEALKAADQEDAIRSFAAEGYDVVFAAFQQFVEPIKKVAPEYPHTKFVLIYGTEDFGLDNAVVYKYDAWEASYVAGVLSATMSESGKLGHVVGYEDDNIVANTNAFLQGARAIREDASVERVNAASFEDPAKGKEIANQMIGKGIDVIFTDAARTSLGVLEACEEQGKFFIGDNTSHGAMAPDNAIADNMYGYGNTIYSQVRSLTEGDFQSGVVVGALKNDIFELLTYEETFGSGVPEEVKDRYKTAVANAKAATQQIKEGKIQVEQDSTK